ncbi:anhydro-N-acetylmuramic acid kinase [Fulvivirga maritima]|uniref:anhydro-N-acetylmuramic acid kinase n=1 Tax=Fulvivirga maritima TaxID=2904247 RepID=UPI001F27649D|nr:anhydro-N-acetylmuramic acid kinase [Fulvivirga maritima]UII28678.1 anhydro-N-acetylmuramic acid kinase [Fulvivirga maritima]
MKAKTEFKVIGLMSGTSLDGLDIAYCHFTKDSAWSFSLEKATMVKYPEKILKTLVGSTQLSAVELQELDHSLGEYIGSVVKDFIDAESLKVDFIASHGHTVFHQPDKNFTTQIGNGNDISAVTQLPVIYDFRSMDVALGGQGAPLVPIGDKLLFHDYEYCLNLGGIANISFEKQGKRIAFDISPCNMILNYLANKLDLEYDDRGKLAEEGMLIPELLEKFNVLNYYTQPWPKSLGYEWVEKEFFPFLDSPSYAIKDLMRTCVEHTAIQIVNVIKDSGGSGKILITGGGAFNDFLISRMRDLIGSNHTLLVPGATLVSFKEAVVFAFLGVLNVNGENNCLASVTGASSDSCGGVKVGF